MKAERKYAITRFDCESVTSHVVLVPLQSGPPHPANDEVESGVAVSMIVLPTDATLRVQSEEQLISPLRVVTLPLPAPPKDIKTDAETTGIREGSNSRGCARLVLPVTTSKAIKSTISQLPRRNFFCLCTLRHCTKQLNYAVPRAPATKVPFAF
jgi:hypothetical protein